MPLAKLSDLKLRLSISDSDSDALLSSLLAGVSDALDEHCGRTLLYAEADATEYFDGGAWDLYLKRWPVTEITSVKESATRDWDAVETLTEDTDYVCLITRGILTRLPDLTDWLEGRQVIQVVYRGGYNDPAEEAIDGVSYVPAHIQEACLLQTQYLWQRRNELGSVNVTLGGPGGAQAWSGTYALLDEIKHMLRRERR